MINSKQLAICKQRGHDPQGRSNRWERCKHCFMWTRTISTVEEREDDPPEDEQDPMYKLDRLTQEAMKLQRRTKAKEK